MKYVDYVYNIIKNESRNLDALYGDYIIYLVGAMSIDTLLENKLLESCGVVDGRQLYVLCDKN